MDNKQKISFLQQLLADNNVDATAIAKAKSVTALEELANANVSDWEYPTDAEPSAGKGALPKTSKFLGTVAEVSDKIESKLEKGVYFHVVNMIDQEGELHTFFLSEPFLKNNAARLVPDQTLMVNVEHRVKDVTTYKDRDGVVQKHRSTGAYFASAVRATAEQAKAMKNNDLSPSQLRTIDKVESKITALGAEDKGAMAQFLGLYLKG